MEGTRRYFIDSTKNVLYPQVLKTVKFLPFGAIMWAGGQPKPLNRRENGRVGHDGMHLAACNLHVPDRPERDSLKEFQCVSAIA